MYLLRKFVSLSSKILIFRWKAIPFPTIPRNSAQFREYLIASLFVVIARFPAMKWRKQKQSFRAIRAIPRNGIPIGNWREPIFAWIFPYKSSPTQLRICIPSYEHSRSSIKIWGESVMARGFHELWSENRTDKQILLLYIYRLTNISARFTSYIHRYLFNQ